MQSRSSVNFFEWKRRRLITRLREEWRMENEIKNYLLLDILFISYWWINWTEKQTEVNTERTFKKSAKKIKCSIFYWREKWWNGKNWKKWWNVEDGDDDSKSCLLHFTKTKTNADRYERDWAPDDFSHDSCIKSIITIRFPVFSENNKCASSFKHSFWTGLRFISEKQQQETKTMPVND